MQIRPIYTDEQIQSSLLSELESLSEEEWKLLNNMKSVQKDKSFFSEIVKHCKII